MSASALQSLGPYIRLLLQVERMAIDAFQCEALASRQGCTQSDGDLVIYPRAWSISCLQK